MWPNRILKKREFPDAATNFKRLRTPLVVDQSIAVSFCLIINSDSNDSFETLRSNLVKISQDTPLAEFVLLTPLNNRADSLKELMQEFSALLKVYGYDGEADNRVLRNSCAEITKGKVMFFLNLRDQLCSRPSTFIFNQLTRSKGEELLIYKKLLGSTQRLGVWRNTFSEVGGFDETIPYQRQIRNLVSRLNKYGVPTLKIHMDHYTVKGEYISLVPPSIIDKVQVSNRSTLNLEKLSL